MQRTTLLIMFKIFNLFLERLKTEDLRKKENVTKIQKLHVDTALYSVSPRVSLLSDSA